MTASRIGNRVAAFVLGASLATALAPPGVDAQAARTPAASAQPASEVVNINTAGEAELERLPGIGPSRAKAIVELRVQMKGFRRVEDLMRVKGIGRKTFQKLAPLVTLGPASTAKETAKR